MTETAYKPKTPPATFVRILLGDILGLGGGHGPGIGPTWPAFRPNC